MSAFDKIKEGLEAALKQASCSECGSRVHTAVELGWKIEAQTLAKELAHAQETLRVVVTEAQRLIDGAKKARAALGYDLEDADATFHEGVQAAAWNLHDKAKKGLE